MNTKLFERLLHEEESPYLDFKKMQYPFASAGNVEKSELLKDILGFCNAWRRSEAYILIGVEEVNGAPSRVHGINESDHLRDHTLQQFVNNLTNRPVQFHYEAFGYEGKQVGIIRIEEQKRPIYLTKDYGKLRRNEVYVRRGTSTDPSKPASLDEIAQMGSVTAEPACEVNVEFLDVEKGIGIGSSIRHESEMCTMPTYSDIPDYPLKAPALRGHRAIIGALDFSNSHYFRELSEYIAIQKLARQIQFKIHNSGNTVAKNVRVELKAKRSDSTVIADKSDLPSKPMRKRDHLNMVDKIVSPLDRNRPGRLDIIKANDAWIIECDSGDLQPGRSINSELFYAAKFSSGAISFEGVVYADNLPKPKTFELSVTFDVSESSMSIEELCEYEV